MCRRCWQRDPGRPFRQAERLAAGLENPPTWLEGFVAYAAARHCNDACEPEHRLVARTLEREWERRLGHLRAAERALAACQPAAPSP